MREKQEIQNVTLALPRKLLTRVKVFAAQQDKSISQLLKEALEQVLGDEVTFERAMKRQLSRMKTLELGLGGAIPWKREDVHE